MQSRKGAQKQRMGKHKPLKEESLVHGVVRETITAENWYQRMPKCAYKKHYKINVRDIHLATSSNKPNNNKANNILWKKIESDEICFSYIIKGTHNAVATQERVLTLCDIMPLREDCRLSLHLQEIIVHKQMLYKTTMPYRTAHSEKK